MRAKRNQRFGRNRQSELDSGSEPAKFLQGYLRFRFHLLTSILTSHSNPATNCKIERKHVDNCHEPERRSGNERRSGLDTRSEEEKFLQGERRSRVHRRSGGFSRYRSFKKARAFARGLGLNCAREWHEYSKSGMKPDDIPVAPHYVYTDEGWAGWSDWLAASAATTYLSRYRFLKKFHRFVRYLGLIEPRIVPLPVEIGEAGVIG